MCTNVLSYKWQHAFCSECCSSVQIPHCQCTHLSAPVSMTNGDQWFIVVLFYKEFSTLWHTPAHKEIQSWAAPWCNSCSRAPCGIRLNLMTTETTSLLGFFPCFILFPPLLLWANSPKSTRIPVYVLASRSFNLRYLLTVPYLGFSIYWFLGKKAISICMDLLHSFNSHILFH